MMRPHAAVSWSGGKDCCLAFMRARDIFDVVALITMFGEDGNRSRSHGLTPKVIAAQADCTMIQPSRRTVMEALTCSCRIPATTGNGGYQPATRTRWLSEETRIAG